MATWCPLYKHRLSEIGAWLKYPMHFLWYMINHPCQFNKTVVEVRHRRVIASDTLCWGNYSSIPKSQYWYSYYMLVKNGNWDDNPSKIRVWNWLARKPVNDISMRYYIQVIFLYLATFKCLIIIHITWWRRPLQLHNPELQTKFMLPINHNFIFISKMHCKSVIIEYPWIKEYILLSVSH